MEQSGLEEAQSVEDFSSAWETWTEHYDYTKPTRGDIRRGVVLAKRPNEIILDIGVKRDAIIPGYELEQTDPARLEGIHVGDEVNVYILRPSDREGNLIVSIRRAREYEDWIRAQEMLDSGELFQSTITGFNQGGLLCAFGRVQAFVPASQIANVVRSRQGGSSDALAQFVGEEMTLQVIEVNRKRRRLIVSERAALRKSRAAQREQLLAEIAPGQVLEGTVTSIRDFGAFVDLGGRRWIGPHLGTVMVAR